MGKILGNRYEIIKQIGGGGMAVVFLAKDTFLDRLVAVKLLRDEFVDDQDFIRRFHKEAKAIASLSHPNIVNIYDFGESDNSTYLVMEYVEGHTLKQIIQENGPMPVDQVIDIGMQICAGIAQAHDQKIVHKDIKPHNILIDKNGIVKVTDFGIAQAVSNMTITHNKGILGSAHYFSPEQAKGEAVDFRSDIYSIGVVLYEMVTGKVPFTGENPVTVALKHIQNVPTLPSHMGVDLPGDLEWIIMKALSKNPLDRFDSAQEIGEELSAVLVDNSKAYYASPTAVANKNRKSISEKSQSREHEVTTAKTHDDATRVLGGNFFVSVNDDTTDQPKVKPSKSSEVKQQQKSQEAPTTKRIKVANLVVAMLIVMGLGFAGFFGIQKLMFKDDVVVPKVVGMTEVEAERALTEAKLLYKLDAPEASKDVPKGRVIRQSPTAETTVKQDREVTLVISKGTEMLKVPNLVGKTKKEATDLLQNMGLGVAKTSTAFDKDYKEDVIVNQWPKADTEVEVGATVDLIISIGQEPQNVKIPNLEKKTLDEAKKAITNAKLSLGTVTEEESTTYVTGTVIRQSLAANGDVQQGSAIDLVVSSGPGPQVKKTYKVEMLVPNTGVLVLEVVDDNGKTTVYSKEHQAGDYLHEIISYKGEGKLHIYSNNSLVETKTLE